MASLLKGEVTSEAVKAGTVETPPLHRMSDSVKVRWMNYCFAFF